MTVYLRRFALPALALSVLLAAPAALAAGKPAPLPPAADAPDKVKPAEVPEVVSNPEAQFHLMLGEMAANRSQPGVAAVEFLEALKTFPDPILAARAATMAYTAGDIGLLEKIARRWLEIEPNSMEAREVILHVSLRQSDVDEAVTQSKAIIEGHGGGRDDGFRQIALMMVRDGNNVATAMNTLNRLAEQYPKESGMHYAIALLALRTDKLDIAETAAREARRLSPDSKENSLLLVGVLVKQKKLDESDTVIDALAKKNKAQRDDIRLAYARLLLEADQRSRARGQLERIVKDNPKSEDALYALGVFDLNDGKVAEARQAFTKLSKSPERGVDAHFQLGRVAEREKDWNLALKEYEQVTSGNQALDAALRRAAVLAKLGRIDDARAQLQQMRIQFPPLGPRLRSAEAEMLLEAGKTNEALATYTDALRDAPDDADFLYGRSLVYEKLNRQKESEADLRAILAKNPDDARALNALGYLLVVNSPDRLKEAQKLIGKAMQIEPEDAAIIDSMGWVSYKLGQKEDARDLLKKAYERNQDPEIAAHLGEVLWVLGQRDEARAVWQRALAEEPDHRALNETMKRLNP